MCYFHNFLVSLKIFQNGKLKKKKEIKLLEPSFKLTESQSPGGGDVHLMLINAPDNPYVDSEIIIPLLEKRNTA